MDGRPFLLVLAAFCGVALVSSECPRDYEEYGDSCVKVFMGHRYDWVDSAVLCARDGAHLVEIHSQDKADFIRQVIEDMQMRDRSDFWTNLVDFGSPGDFIWMTSRTGPASFQDWLDGQPSDRVGYSAVLLDCDTGSDFRWRNFPPTHEALPICEMPSVAATTPGPDTTTDAPPDTTNFPRRSRRRSEDDDSPPLLDVVQSWMVD